MNDRFCWKGISPLAEPKNILQGKCWRFTVLADRLLRMEYDPQGIFEDRASQSVFHRDFPKVEFNQRVEDGLLILETAALRLEYREDQPFTAETLSVCLKTPPATQWKFGDICETLGGTIKTLDEADGNTELEDGVCARCGFAVMDDSKRSLLNEEGWLESRRPETLDLYFFGYGHDYIGAVQALYRLTGVPPMLPAYALGNWWSRYHKYTQEEYLDLMKRFKEEEIPFTVGVVDMDWHLTEIPDADPTYHNHPGWTGYTWNEEFFPDYKQFLKDLHGLGVKTALNLHPAQGVRRHEAMYEKMCAAVGKEPDGSAVHFDFMDRKYMEAYFDVLHHPYEQDGVDFWWMDFQQRNTWWIHSPEEFGKVADPYPDLDPLWMLNHLHIIDIQKSGKRPMFFSRYAGPGSQRYPVGFSGDTYITWDSLDFQPYFTATASNIGYGWWSHDIGGHMGGYRDDDLATRWVQLGVFSPILRLHSNNQPTNTKEPWSYGEKAYKNIKSALQLRHRLFPYIYTMNYRCHKDLLPLVQPLYYTYPEKEAAYQAKNQFWFGDQMMIAPITQKGEAANGIGKVRAWIPAGVWTDFFTGQVYQGLGGRWLDLHRSMESIPALCKAGAIVPLGDESALEWMVFPGGDNTFNLYEDIGDGFGYQTGEYTMTQAALTFAETKAVFTVGKGKERAQSVKFRGYSKPESVLLNGKEIAWTYDSKTNTIEVAVGSSDGFTLEILGEQLCYHNQDRYEKMMALVVGMQAGMRFKDGVARRVLLVKDLPEKRHRLPNYIHNECSSPNEFLLGSAILEYHLCDQKPPKK